MICWSCERSAGVNPICASCGAIQPPDPRATHFDVLGVERRYDLDLADLERRYRELSRQFHPDRFTRTDPRARRASLQRTVQLNDAWTTLRDPIRRAEYMLALAGIDVASEEEGQRYIAPGLLAEMLELRSELGEARLDGDHEKVRSMEADMRSRVQESLKTIGEGLTSGDRAKLQKVAEHLVALRYYRRFLEEVDAHHEAHTEALHG